MKKTKTKTKTSADKVLVKVLSSLQHAVDTIKEFMEEWN